MDIASTTVAALGGGVLGAVIKLIAGLLGVWIQNAKDKRDERMYFVEKNIEVLKMRPDPADEYVSHTRRVLAWAVCFTFCAICLLWAVFPGYPIGGDGGVASKTVSLFFYDSSVTSNLATVRSTGAIVWELIPFMSMVLMTYFTPNLRK